MKTTLKKSADPLKTRADLLVVPLGSPASIEGDPLQALDEALSGTLARAIDDDVLDGKSGSSALFHLSAEGGPRRALIVGVGDGDTDAWRRAGNEAGRRARTLRARVLSVSADGDAGAERVGALVDGIGTGARRFERFLTSEDTAAPIAERVLVHGGGLKASDLTRAARISQAVNGARDLVDTPGNHLTPTALAQYARDLASATPGLTCTVLGQDELEELGAGSLLAVSQGSAQEPKMIVLRHSPAGARGKEVLGLIGKAVTFDTGGISIKPSSGMEEMKMDMAGGAAVIEAAALIAALKVPVEVLAVVPAVENMPSDRAVKPGDVVTAMNGTTIEVINTDAEGRLILADALTWAARNGATRMLDLATLTGAVIVALGEVYAGLLGSDDDWIAAVRAAGEASGDLAWPLPLHERYRPLIESKVADLANSSNKRQAGTIYAAQFLREFTDGLPWCHLDVAGTAMPGSGATGFGVRLMLELAEGLARGGR